MGRRLAWLIGLLLCLLPLAAQAEKDGRLALLIANQRGWKGDPFLRYAIRGDLRPMAETLRRIGFSVTTLENQGPDAVRRALQKLQRRIKQGGIHTFVLYYSGHADRKYVHLGPRGKRPFRYSAFVRFLKEMPVKRRFAFLDACFSGEVIRQFGSFKKYKRLVRKGFRGVRQVDLSKNFPNQGEQKGLQIISSSLDLSWESLDYKASIFTHHLLQGLRGQADQDRDGKISVDELFNFVSNKMHSDIRQKPQLFGVVQRSNTYALAPAYHSRLWIGPDVVGRLKIRVANFLWTRKKQKRSPLRLAVVHGTGLIELQRDGQCFQQKLLLPKGREAKLSTKWQKARCNRKKLVRKGLLELPARRYIPPPRQRDWSLELSSGLLVTPVAGGDFLGGGTLGIRHRYWGVSVGLWGTSIQFQDQIPRAQLLLALQAEGGYRFHWQRLDLFAGLTIGANLLLQDIQQNTQSSAFFQYGATLLPGLRLTSDWALTLRVSAGGLLGQLGGELRHLFVFSALLGIRYTL